MLSRDLSERLMKAAAHRVLKDYASGLAQEHAVLIEVVRANGQQRATLPAGDILLAELARLPDTLVERTAELHHLLARLEDARVGIKVGEPFRNSGAWAVRVESGFDIPRILTIAQGFGAADAIESLADVLQDA